MSDKPKGKAPAFQFYVLDFMFDADGLSAASCGIWIRMLCKLHRAKERGEMTATIDAWCRKCNCGKLELENFLRENDVEEVADVTVADGIMTVKSRRMIKERKEREAAARRQRDYMERRKNDGEMINNDKNLTRYSSSSSSSSYKGRDINPPVEPGNLEERIAATEALSSLASLIKGWDFNEGEDLEFFARLLEEFPYKLISKTIEDLRVYQERPSKVYKNLHSALRNWIKAEAARSSEPEEVKPQARLDEDGNPLVLVGGDWITNRAFDEGRAGRKIIRKGNEWVYAATKGG